MNCNRVLYNLLLCLFLLAPLSFSQPYTFAITPCAPMTICTIGDQFTGIDLLADGITSRINGYEIDLIKLLSYLNGWDLTQWTVVCQDQASVYDSVQNGSATLGFGGVNVSYTSLYEGFEFSLPTFYTGLKLMSRVWPDKSIWTLFASFEINLWLAMLGTVAFMGIIIWILEDQTLPWKNKERSLINFKEMVWQAFSGIFFAAEVRLQKFPARIVWLCFCFLILILTAAYNADLTTKMSSNTYSLKFSTLAQAANVGARIVTLEPYRALISGYNVKNLIVLPNNLDSIDKIEQMFLNGEVDGLVLDSGIISKLNTRYPCSSKAFDTTIVAFNYGIIYSGSINSTFRKDVDTSILTIKESREFQDVLNQNVIVASQDQSCANNIPTLTIRRLGGPWVIFAVSVGVAVIIDRINAFLDKKRGRRYKSTKKGVDEMDAEERKFVLDSYLMTTDYIHIPSKDIHLKLENEIKGALDDVEQTLKDKFNVLERRVINAINNQKTQEMLFGAGSTGEIQSPENPVTYRRFDFAEGKAKME